MKLGRRGFLKTVPAAAAASAIPAVLSSCKINDTPVDFGSPELPPRGAPEKHLNSVCGACPGGCGIRARVVDGRLVGIAGNPLHPVNRGALCPLGVAGPHVLYHPDRLRGPMRRSGDVFEPIPWKDAIAEVTRRLGDLRARDLPHTVALLDGTRGQTRALAQRFMSAYGSPNHLDGRPWDDVVPSETLRAMQGVGTGPVFDLERAHFILAFGSGWLGGSASPVDAARSYGIARRGRKERRVRVVHVESRLSMSAAQADTWIPIVPGTEGTLALGLLHMVLREGLEDRSFLDNWSHGFDLLRGQVLRDYHPAAVSEATGVPVATIIRLARDFASNRPAVAVGDEWKGPGAQSSEVRMAIHALNAVVGAINAPGGVLFPLAPPYAPLPAAPEDDKGRAGLAKPPLNPTHSAGAISLLAWQDGQASYPINLLIAYGSDPLATLGGGRQARDAIRRVPFIVSFSSFLDETARISDLVLPDHTYLERWQDDPCATSQGYAVMGLRHPVVEPIHDTRAAPEVLSEIARGLGGAVAQAMPWKSFTEVIKQTVSGIHSSGRGALLDVPEAAAWIGTMERAGWRASLFGTFDEFWDILVERGGWWDPVYDPGELGRVLATESGKFEFAPLVKALEPHKPSVPTAPEGFPLRLQPYPLYAAYGDSLGPVPWVQDALGRQTGHNWTLWVEISTQDARNLGIDNGQFVDVTSAQGSVRARARVLPGIRPGVVAMPLGPGGSVGRKCQRSLKQTAGALGGLKRAGKGETPRFDETWVKVSAA